MRSRLMPSDLRHSRDDHRHDTERRSLHWTPIEDPNFLGAGIYVRGQLVGRVAVGMALGAMSEAQRETLGQSAAGAGGSPDQRTLALGFGVILSWRISTPPVTSWQASGGWRRVNGIRLSSAGQEANLAI
ncbi:MAG: hypothetical protein HS103_00540 [Anaerolineales bacterium]|nr:hypothetical protein [Anaerolineales bacterium]